MWAAFIPRPAQAAGGILGNWWRIFYSTCCICSADAWVIDPWKSADETGHNEDIGGWWIWFIYSWHAVPRQAGHHAQHDKKEETVKSTRPTLNAKVNESSTERWGISTWIAYLSSLVLICSGLNKNERVCQPCVQMTGQVWERSKDQIQSEKWINTVTRKILMVKHLSI